MNVWRSTALATIGVMLGGCGYHLSGQGGISVIPEHVRVLVVVPFESCRVALIDQFGESWVASPSVTRVV